MMPPKDNWIRSFSVTDTKIHKKGFTVYKVTSIVHPKDSPEALTRIVVWKRYNDFKKLHQDLLIKHKKLYLKDKFPPFAKPKLFGRFEKDVIEERRLCAVKLLQFVADHPPLFTCSAVIKFFQSGYPFEDLKPSETNEENPKIIVSTSNGNASNTTISVPSSESATLSDSGTNDHVLSDTDEPYLNLGGTWNYPKTSETISLNSQSSDDHTTFTDTDSALSTIGSPLQSADLQLFDPLFMPEEHGGNSNEKETVTNDKSWLLSLQVTSSETVPEENRQSGEKFSVGNEEVNSTDHFISSGETELSLSDDLFSRSLLDDQHLETYISEASNFIIQAQHCKASENFEEAFSYYKLAISSLLNGVQSDKNVKRRLFVRDKTAKYLNEAERLYSEHIAKQEEAFKWNSPGSHLIRPLSELKAYRVLGIVGKKVMLVLNVIDNKCYIIKVLHKSPCPILPMSHHIIPQKVPYLVNLHYLYESDTAVFLVLDHVSGGRLWDHISLYFHSLPPTPVHTNTKHNAYIGKRILDESKENTSVCKKTNETMLCLGGSGDHRRDQSTSPEESSYLELIQEYAAVVEHKFSDSGDCTGLIEKSNNSGSIFPNQEHVDKIEVPEDSCDLQFPKLPSFTNVVSPDCGDCTLDCTSDGDISNKLSGLTVFSDNEIKSSEIMYTSNNNTFDHYDECFDTINHLEINPKFESTESNIHDLDLDTKSLVENAQKLLESVTKTLLISETIETNHEKQQVSENSLSNDSNYLKSADTNGQRANESKLTVSNTGSVMENVRSQSKDRRISRVRKYSTSQRSLERRYSSDDMFDVRSKTVSGSIDRSSQWAKLHSTFDEHRPRLLTTTVQQWAAELLVCLESLHSWGIICLDLMPKNILLGVEGHLVLSYKCQLSGVDYLTDQEAVDLLYAAPEIKGIFQVTSAADWWSYGAILFELITGKPLYSCHPGGIYSHTIINLPEFVPEDASSLINQLLKYNPQERLGFGENGAERIKAHPFFSGIDWKLIVNAGFTYHLV